jgi:hypothetical protein
MKDLVPVASVAVPVRDRCIGGSVVARPISNATTRSLSPDGAERTFTAVTINTATSGAPCQPLVPFHVRSSA